MQNGQWYISEEWSAFIEVIFSYANITVITYYTKSWNEKLNTDVQELQNNYTNT